MGNGERRVGMYALELVKEVIKIFWSTRPGYDLVLNVTEPAGRLVGHPTHCHFLKVLHEEIGDYGWQR
jgi:hypothetical protein